MATIPYDSWVKFCKAFECSNSTEFYAEDYPEYKAYINAGGSDVDIVAHLLAYGGSAQEGLDCFVSAVLGGSRYVCYAKDDVKACVQMLLASGAKYGPDTKDLLFGRSYAGMDDCFEDEIANYNARALLINALNIDPCEYVPDWSSIKPMYWEDIESVTDINYDTRRFMYLRFVLNR